MSYSFLDLAKDVLTASDKPLTYQEIWELAKSKGLSDRIQTTGQTPWQTLGARLYVDVRDNENTELIKVGKRPARFFLKSRESAIKADTISIIEQAEASKPQTKIGFHERALHPLLTYFVYANPAFNRGKSIFTKTIFHEKSVKSGYNEWIHPDIVGFYLPFDDWKPSVIEFNRLSDNDSLKLFSFELKKSLTKANYREAYFQAVSNSSWAHEGWIAAPNILQDDDFLSELERLASSFGIGIIQLNLEEIDSSKILYPARTRSSLDWETINKLCEQNPDFNKFLEDVKIDFESKRIHKTEYDDVLQDIDGYIANKIQK